LVFCSAIVSVIETFSSSINKIPCLTYIPYLRSVKSNFEEVVSPPNHQWNCILSEDDILEKLLQNNYNLKDIKDIAIGEKTEAGRVISVDMFDSNEQKITLKTNDFRLLLGPTLVRSSLFTIDKIGGIDEKNKEEEKNKKNILIKSEQKDDEVCEEKTVRDILNEENDLTISELIKLLNRPKEKKNEQSSAEKIERIIERTHDVSYSIFGKGSGHGVGLSQWGAYGMAVQGYNHDDILKYYYQGINLIKMY